MYKTWLRLSANLQFGFLNFVSSRGQDAASKTQPRFIHKRCGPFTDQAINMINLYFFILSLLVGLFCYQLFKKRKVDRNEHDDLFDVFDRYPIKPPILEARTIFWWPTFTVTFLDKTDYYYAKSNGLFERFNNRVQKKFMDQGPPAEMAVTYQWIEGKKKISEVNGPQHKI